MKQDSLDLDYVPAQVSEGKVWYIYYWVKNPQTRELVRIRYKFNRIKLVSERRREARRICTEINHKLYKGWNPLIEQEAPRAYTPFTDAVDTFLKEIQRQIDDGTKRPDTMRSYSSSLRLFSTFLEKRGQNDMYTLFFTHELVREYLDDIYFERKLSAITRNNHLTFLKNFGEWCVGKRFVKVNPCQGIKPLKASNQKKRTVIPRPIIKKFLNDVQISSGFRVLCGLIYYCLIRRTELTLLKVSSIQLSQQRIIIPGELSKNKREQPVSIPEVIIPLLIEHLKTAKSTDFLFSSNNYLPGQERLSPKKVTDEWVRQRKEHKWPEGYQLYSLKDSGITHMLEDGIPQIDVRDQARHTDISITNRYIAASGQRSPSSLKNWRA